MIKNLNFKRFSSAIIPSIILFTLTLLLTAILIHNLGDVIRFVLGQAGEDYAVIMDQLQTAELSLPYILIAVLSLLLGLLLTQRKKGFLSFLIGFIAVIILVIIALYFTDINTIRFGTVLRFLINAIRHGVL